MLGLVPTMSGVVRFRDRLLKQQLSAVAYIPQRSQIDWDYPITVWNVYSPSRPSQEIVEDALVRVGMLDLRSRQIADFPSAACRAVTISLSRVESKATSPAASKLYR